MRSTRALAVLALSALTLAACDKADDASGPGGVTLSEARALDEAAEMLEQRRAPADAPAAARAASTPASSSAP